MTDLYAGLVLELSNANIDKVFTYRIPEDIRDLVFVGCPVFVRFGTVKRPVRAYIVELSNETEFDKSKIKDIEGMAEFDIPASRQLLGLAAHIKKMYGVSFSKALSTVMPVKSKLKRRNNAETNAFLDLKAGESELLKELNEEQQTVYDEFCDDYNKGLRKTYLLHGITGSGKTLVYINMINMVIKMGRQAIVLIPEISLTYQSIKRFISVFGDRVAVLNSKMSKGERVKQFERVLNKEADIIIGPRSALFTPFENTGLIIIDEEHDNAYKNESVPRYDSRDLARKLAEISDASLVLASATPSPESYKKYKDGEYSLLRLNYRAGKEAVLPNINIVDLRKELKDGNTGVFSIKLRELIEDRLAKNEQIMLFMNRRGMSNFVSCRSCGQVIKCPHCDVALTLHNNNRLYCHYCAYNTMLPKLCPSCSSPYIAGFGVGTQKLELLTKKAFPKARVLRLDRDSDNTKTAGMDILKKFSNNEADILVGTQMIVKGHDFPNVTLVGIVAADTSLYINDYTGAQRTYELLTQASGRAGRADKKGEVVIQTYNPEHYAILACRKHDYDLYYENEITYRALAMYPPIVHILGVQLSAKDEKKLNEALEMYVKLLSGFIKENSQFIGPVVPNIYKLRDYFRKIIYIKNSEYAILTGIKESMDLLMEGNKLFSDISIIYDLV